MTYIRIKHNALYIIILYIRFPFKADNGVFGVVEGV